MTEIISSKLCTLCNEVNKFKIVKGKMSGRKCIKCVSKKNNEKLKEKGYYKTYYLEHAEKIKQTDKERYHRNKEKNLVKFTFESGTVIEPENSV
jgi:hypothetical protein